MPNFAEGPFAVDTVVSDDDGHDIILGYRIPDAGHPILVASVFSDKGKGPGCISHKDGRAIARLMAAAPDLLALLREIVDDASPCTSGCSLMVDAKLIERAESLIAKAEGK